MQKVGWRSLDGGSGRGGGQAEGPRPLQDPETRDGRALTSSRVVTALTMANTRRVQGKGFAQERTSETCHTSFLPSPHPRALSVVGDTDETGSGKVTVTEKALGAVRVYITAQPPARGTGECFREEGTRTREGRGVSRKTGSASCGQDRVRGNLLKRSAGWSVVFAAEVVTGGAGQGG